MDKGPQEARRSSWRAGDPRRPPKHSEWSCTRRRALGSSSRAPARPPGLAPAGQSTSSPERGGTTPAPRPPSSPPDVPARFPFGSVPRPQPAQPGLVRPHRPARHSPGAAHARALSLARRAQGARPRGIVPVGAGGRAGSACARGAPGRVSSPVWERRQPDAEDLSAQPLRADEGIRQAGGGRARYAAGSPRAPGRDREIPPAADVTGASPGLPRGGSARPASHPSPAPRPPPTPRSPRGQLSASETQPSPLTLHPPPARAPQPARPPPRPAPRNPPAGVGATQGWGRLGGGDGGPRAAVL